MTTPLKNKISDFGFAISTVKNRLLETFCGSYAYCCPQILRGEPYDGKKADVWSMGVVLYAMACARLPFSDDDMVGILFFVGVWVGVMCYGTPVV